MGRKNSSFSYELCTNMAGKSPKGGKSKGKKKAASDKITFITPMPKVAQLHLNIQHLTLRHPAQHLSVPQDLCTISNLRKLISEKVGFTSQELNIWFKFNVADDQLVPLEERDEFNQVVPGKEVWPYVSLQPDGSPQKLAWNVFHWIKKMKVETAVEKKETLEKPVVAAPTAMEALSQLQHNQVESYKATAKKSFNDPTIALPKLIMIDLECNVVYEQRPPPVDQHSKFNIEFDEAEPRELFKNSGNSNRGFFIEAL